MSRRFLIPMRSAFAALIQWLLSGAGLFLGLYALCSLLLSALLPLHYDANIWWIDLRALPGVMRPVLIMLFSLALLHRAVFPTTGGKTLAVRRVVLLLLMFVLLSNSLAVWSLHLERLQSSPGRFAGVWLGMPIPLSLMLTLIVIGLLYAPRQEARQNKPRYARRLIHISFAAAFFAIVGSLAQMLSFGESDYRRPADAIVVYGCKAYPDGRPSQALADRVHTACELYRQGLAPVIVMSGGPVDGSMHETQVMADYAVSLGVPREAIVLDRFGYDTQASAEHLPEALCSPGRQRPLRVLAVSHDYHLPRVKLSLQRRGITAYTVPCEIRRGMPGKPYFMARETAAWWYYYFAPALALW